MNTGHLITLALILLMYIPDWKYYREYKRKK